MERATFVAESVLSGRELAKVARGHRTNIIVEFEDDSSGGRGVNCDVKLRTRGRQSGKTKVDVGPKRTNTLLWKGKGRASAGEEIRMEGTYPLDIVRRRRSGKVRERKHNEGILYSEEM